MMSLLHRVRFRARAAYERWLSPHGARSVGRLLREGGPRQLKVPLEFLFTEQLPASAEKAAVQIETLRAEIAARSDTFRFTRLDDPLGPVRLAQHAPAKTADVSCRQLATAFSVSRRWGLFLHLCAEELGARTILELGSCVGISGAYLASGTTRPLLLTLEGSPALAAIARQTLGSVTDRAEVILGTFAETLPATLERLRADGVTVDLAFVDGHHEEAATLRYVDAIASQMSRAGLIVLDDIYLYEGMWAAWQKVVSDRRFTAVNVGRFGLLVCGDASSPVHSYDLSRYTGYWRIGPPRKVH
jgi:predicted O-methyltransferase YrrM